MSNSSKSSAISDVSGKLRESRAVGENSTQFMPRTVLVVENESRNDDCGILELCRFQQIIETSKATVSIQAEKHQGPNSGSKRESAYATIEWAADVDVEDKMYVKYQLNTPTTFLQRFERLFSSRSLQLKLNYQSFETNSNSNRNYSLLMAHYFCTAMSEMIERDRETYQDQFQLVNVDVARNSEVDAVDIVHKVNYVGLPVEVAKETKSKTEPNFFVRARFSVSSDKMLQVVVTLEIGDVHDVFSKTAFSFDPVNLVNDLNVVVIATRELVAVDALHYVNKFHPQLSQSFRIDEKNCFDQLEKSLENSLSTQVEFCLYFIHSNITPSFRFNIESQRRKFVNEGCSTGVANNSNDILHFSAQFFQRRKSLEYTWSKHEENLVQHWNQTVFSSTEELRNNLHKAFNIIVDFSVKHAMPEKYKSRMTYDDLFINYRQIFVKLMESGPLFSWRIETDFWRWLFASYAFCSSNFFEEVLNDNFRQDAVAKRFIKAINGQEKFDSPLLQNLKP